MAEDRWREEYASYKQVTDNGGNTAKFAGLKRRFEEDASLEGRLEVQRLKRQNEEAAVQQSTAQAGGNAEIAILRIAPSREQDLAQLDARWHPLCRVKAGQAQAQGDEDTSAAPATAAASYIQAAKRTVELAHLYDVLQAISGRDATEEVQHLGNALEGAKMMFDCNRACMVVEMSLTRARELLAPGTMTRLLPSKVVTVPGNLRLYISKVPDDWEEVLVHARVDRRALSLGDLVRTIERQLDHRVGHVIEARAGLHTTVSSSPTAEQSDLLKKMKLTLAPELLCGTAADASLTGGCSAPVRALGPEVVTLTMTRAAAKSLQKAARMLVKLDGGGTVTVCLSGGPIRSCCRRCGSRNHYVNACKSRPVAPPVVEDEPALKAAKAAQAAAAKTAATAAAATAAAATAPPVLASSNSEATSASSTATAPAATDSYQTVNRRRKGSKVAATAAAVASAPVVATLADAAGVASPAAMRRPAAHSPGSAGSAATASRNAFHGLDVDDGDGVPVSGTGCSSSASRHCHPGSWAEVGGNTVLEPQQRGRQRAGSPRRQRSVSNVSMRSDENPTGKRCRSPGGNAAPAAS